MKSKTPEYTIHFSQRLSDSPVLWLAVRAWSHTLERGVADPSGADVISGEHRVIWIEHTESKLPVAIMTYSAYATTNAWIYLAYTEPKHRRKGLYARMYKYLVKKAKKDGFKKIQSGVKAGNTAMEATATKMGRSPEYVVWSQIL